MMRINTVRVTVVRALCSLLDKRDGKKLVTSPVKHRMIMSLAKSILTTTNKQFFGCE